MTIIDIGSNSLDDVRAQMSTQAINDLPDSAFAYIEPGGTKDSSGKTTPRSLRHFPIHDAAHVRNALARAPQSPFGKQAMPKILAAAKKFGIDTSQTKDDTGPTDLAVIRAVAVQSELRDSAAADDGLGVLYGHFSVFDQWYEVNSLWEGQFLERTAPGAFDRTLAEDRSSMKILFNHGRDPGIGNKVLAPIRDVGTDSQGAYYEGPLLDTSYNRDLLPGLKAGVYGASMRMVVTGESVNKKPERSAVNPDGIPERTITEARVFEFGPVTFPASPGASAGVRSLTDEFYDYVRDHDSGLYQAALRAAGYPDLTGGSAARSTDRGDRPERATQPTRHQRRDDEALRLRGILR